MVIALNEYKGDTKQLLFDYSNGFLEGINKTSDKNHEEKCLLF